MWRKSAEVKAASQPSDALSTSRLDQASTPLTGFQATSQQESQAAPQSTQSASVVPATTAQNSSKENAFSGASRIGAGLKVRGEFSGKSDLYVDGEVQGEIHLEEARVTVGPTGRVRADIEAREIVVDGTVEGNLKGTGNVRLGATSRVLGDVLTPSLTVDDGARLRGSVETIRASEPSVPSAEAAAPAEESDVLHPVHADVETE